jgi:RNA polymerase sigma factor, sigma-70 family
MSVEEYNLCVDNLSDRVLRFLARSLGSVDMAQDILQDAFVALWQKRQEVAFDKCKSYLFTSAYHLMLNTLRKEKLRNNLYITEQQEQNSFSDLSDALQGVMSSLSEKQRSALLLRDYEGYSYKEIADMLSVSQEQVKINIFRARIKAKELIGNIDNII